MEAGGPVSDCVSGNGEHSWWYIDQQELHEAIIFSCSDLRAASKSREGTVHGASQLPDQDGQPPRQALKSAWLRFSDA